MQLILWPLDNAMFFEQIEQVDKHHVNCLDKFDDHADLRSVLVLFVDAARASFTSVLAVAGMISKTMDSVCKMDGQGGPPAICASWLIDIEEFARSTIAAAKARWRPTCSGSCRRFDSVLYIIEVAVSACDLCCARSVTKPQIFLAMAGSLLPVTCCIKFHRCAHATVGLWCLTS